MGEKELLLTYGCQKSKLKISFAFQFSLNGRGCTAILASPVIGTHARVFHTICTRVRVSHAFFTHSRAHRNPPPRARTRAFFTRVPPPRTRTHAISTRARVFHSFFTRAFTHARARACPKYTEFPRGTFLLARVRAS